jgi:hypothetical protein
VSGFGFQRSRLETSILERHGSVELNGPQRLNPSMELSAGDWNYWNLWNG